ncbi:MAG: hypothetical protein COA99_13685 [Moraxellaceae bacterium]|nr:MAG: hypothetical protein COA99_13685 [Moraxellaceae bacterium]
MKVVGNRKRQALNFGVVLLISLLCTFLIVGIDGNLRGILLYTLYALIIGTSISLGCHLITSRLFRRESWQQNPKNSFIYIVLLVTAFIMINVIVINVLWFYLAHGVSASTLFQDRIGIFTMLLEFVIGVIIYLIVLANHYAKHIATHYENISQVEKELAYHRYETLKNQLIPHFLFNSLNTLGGLIYKDVDKAEEFLARLSNIYRRILDFQHVEIISISEELGFIDDFMHLNKVRFQGQLSHTVQVVNVNQYIVPMALQLVFENAIKHNVVSAKYPLQITLIEEKGYLVVQNKIRLKQLSGASHALGMKNLKARYSRFTEKKIEINETDELYTVRIPILLKA